MKTAYFVYESDGYHTTAHAVFSDKADGERAAALLGYDGCCDELEFFETWEEYENRLVEEEEKRKAEMQARRRACVLRNWETRHARRAARRQAKHAAAQRITANLERAKQLLKASGFKILPE